MWCTFQDRAQRRAKPKEDAHRVLTAAEFARVKLGFEADEKQEAVLNSRGKRGILNCSRQWGKSTVTAAKAVHGAWEEAGSLVLVASPTERQSGEFLRKAGDFVRRLGTRPRGKNAGPRDEPSGDKAARRNSRLVESRNRTQFFGTGFWDWFQP